MDRGRSSGWRCPCCRVGSAISDIKNVSKFSNIVFPCGLTPTYDHSYARTPPILPLSITICKVPIPPLIRESSSSSSNSTFAPLHQEPSIVPLLALLIPSIVHIPLSIPFLNESRMAPISKDEDLHSGALQLPAATVVVVTDSDVSEGTITQGTPRSYQVKMPTV